LGHGKTVPGQLFHRCQAGVIGFVGRQNGRSRKPFYLVQLGPDDLQGAFARQVVETGGKGGHPEIRILGGDGYGHRLGGPKKLQVHSQTLVGKVAFFLGDKQGGRRDERQCGYGNFLTGMSGDREKK